MSKPFTSKDEDDCEGCRVGLGLCQDQRTCLADKCDGECRHELVDCEYGGAGVECAPSTDGWVRVKSESSGIVYRSNEIDCSDWTRRQVEFIKNSMTSK